MGLSHVLARPNEDGTLNVTYGLGVSRRKVENNFVRHVSSRISLEIGPEFEYYMGQKWIISIQALGNVSIGWGSWDKNYGAILKLGVKYELQS